MRISGAECDSSTLMIEANFFNMQYENQFLIDDDHERDMDIENCGIENYDSELEDNNDREPLNSSINNSECTINEKKGKKERGYNIRWLEVPAFKQWLVLNHQNRHTVHCSKCDAFLKAKLDTLKNHARSKRHRRFLNNMRMPTEAELQVPEKNQCESEIRRAEIELKIVGMASRLNIPFHQIHDITDCFKEIERDYDGPCLQDLRLSATRCQSIATNVIGITAKTDIAEKLKNNLFNVCIDETSNVSKDCVLAIEVRFPDFDKKKIETLFWELSPMFIKGEEASTNSQRIFECIESSFEYYNVPLSNIISASFDGCSTMTGRLKGVKPLLEEHIPNMISVICPAHKTHLIMKHAVSQLPPEIYTLITDINVLVRSPHRKHDFENLIDLYDAPQHKILNHKEIRWLSLEAVILRILELWEIIIDFTIELIEKNYPKAQLVHDEISRPETKCYFLIIKKVSYELNSLNRLLQREGVVLHILRQEIEKRFRNIILIIFKHTSVKNIPIDAINLYDINNFMAYRDFDIDPGMMEIVHVHGNTLFNFFKTAAYFVLSAALHFKYYFDDFCLPFLSAVECLNPNNAILIKFHVDNPDLFYNLLRECEGLCADVEFRESLVQQWELLPQYYADLKTLAQGDVVSFWMNLREWKNEYGEISFSDIGEFSLYVLSISHSNVFPERRFSEMNWRMSKLKNRLSIESLNGLLHSSQAVRMSNNNILQPTREMINKVINGRFYNNIYQE
ncbi:hypothetical protein TKK_0018085 [Trichogramma kaykai]